MFFDFTGRDGITQTRVQIPGGYMGQDGIFDYIIESDDTCNYRLFVSDDPDTYNGGLVI